MHADPSEVVTQRAQKIHDNPAVTFTVTNTAPSGAPSADQFALWRSDPKRFISVAIDADGADTINGYFAGWDSGASKWRKIALLNSGDDVDLTANVGFEQVLEFVVGSFTELRLILAASPSATLVGTVKRIDVWE